MHKFSKSLGINLIKENLSWKIDYLDLNLNLLKHTFYPYRKDKNKVNYLSSKYNNHTQINPKNDRDQTF